MTFSVELVLLIYLDRFKLYTGLWLISGPEHTLRSYKNNLSGDEAGNGKAAEKPC